MHNTIVSTLLVLLLYADTLKHKDGVSHFNFGLPEYINKIATPLQSPSNISKSTIPSHLPSYTTQKSYLWLLLVLLNINLHNPTLN